MSKPKIITLCGSSRFVQIMAVCAWLLEKEENAICMGLHLLPTWYPDCPADHLAEHEGVADQMDALHLHKIDLSDEIFVIDWHGYIGASTSNEMSHARLRNVPVRLLSESQLQPRIIRMLSNANRGNMELTKARK